MAVARWDPSDLVRRVLHSLDVASRIVRALGQDDSDVGGLAGDAPGAAEFLRQKVVSETAMLLLCVEPARGLDERIRERFDEVARLVLPLARQRDLLAAICLDPGMARDHAAAHILLTKLGYPDPVVDRLLSAASMGFDFGPERLPHRRLEGAWLARIRQEDVLPGRAARRLVADSMLGRPMDSLGSTRMDIYAFTHSVMYASDMGTRRVALPRSRASVAADAELGLAHALDTDDFDLAAELLLTWPMLGLRWSPAAAFAFGVLTRKEDERGFLPGSTFDPARYSSSIGEERSRYMLVTCYHTVYVMGFLCALALRPGCAPPAAVAPARRARGAARAVGRLLAAEDRARSWRDAFTSLTDRQQDALAPLLLAMVLRRSRTAGDLGRIRAALEVALAHDLAHMPAPVQAAALLRRTQALEECVPAPGGKAACRPPPSPRPR